MAVKDVITRGIGPSTSISFFITGGFWVGDEATAAAVRIMVAARDRRITINARDRRVPVKRRNRRIVVD